MEYVTVEMKRLITGILTGVIANSYFLFVLLKMGAAFPTEGFNAAITFLILPMVAIFVMLICIAATAQPLFLEGCAISDNPIPLSPPKPELPEGVVDARIALEIRKGNSEIGKVLEDVYGLERKVK